MIVLKLNPRALTSKGQLVKQIDFISPIKIIDVVRFSQFQHENVYFVRNGAVVDGEQYAVDGDEIIIIPKIAEPVTAFFAAIAASAIFQTIVVIATIASIGLAIYSAVTGTRKPSFGSSTQGNGIDNGSPTYGWDGIQNTASVAIPVGIIYGQHRVGGNIIGRYVNTDGDKNYLNVLIALGEGEIDSLSSIYINGNPIENFDDISYETKLGTNVQTPISNFNQIHDTRAVNVNLLQSSAHVYTTVGTNLNSIDIHFLLGSGLFQQDSSNGNLSSWTVTYKVEYKLHAAGSYTDLGNIDINAFSRSAVRRVYRIEGLTAGQYDVRITKQSADSDFYHTGDLTWDTVDEIVNEDLAYPNTALLAISALATNQLSGSEPTITSIVKGVKISQPQVMNGMDEVDWEDYYYDPIDEEYKLLSDDTPLTWDGSTYVTKWGANPVWCLMDLLLNTRYGLGNYIDTTMIDLASFVSMSQYCENKLPDGNGGYEKRSRLDIVLDASSKALDMIFTIATSFRGLLFYSSGTIKLKIDKIDTPVQLFGMGNIQEGSLVQTWLSLKQRYNVIEVQFLNKDKDYIQDTVIVIDEVALADGEPIRKKQMKVFTTSVSQAIREGRFVLWVNKYLKRMVTIKAGIDAVICEPGDVISVAHDVPAWGIGSGRIQSGSTTTVIELQDPVALQTGITYQAMVQFADDTIEERTIITPPGTVTQVTVSSAFSSVPTAYDKYSVGQITIETKPFRILSMQIDNEQNAEIMAIEYNESIYDDSEPALPTPNYSALTLGIPFVTNVNLTSGVVRLTDGTIASTIDVWFTPPDNTSVYVMYAKAKIYLSDNNGASWVFIGETNDNHFQINKGLIDGTTYMVAVVGVGANGDTAPISTSPQATLLLVGKSEPPSDVTTFLVNQSRDRLKFGWSAVTDVDLSGYEIRYGQSWEAGAVIATQIKDTTYISLFLNVGTFSYFLKAIDTSGNYSTNATEAILTVDIVPFQNIIQSYAEQTAWAGTKVNTEVTGDNLKISDGELSGTYETPVRDNSYVATFKIDISTVVVDTSGDRRFDDDTTTGFDTDPLARFSGQEVVGAIGLEISTSLDNITFTPYEEYQNGDYTCRYFKLRLTFTRADITREIELTNFDYYADLPDVDEFGSDTVSNAGTGKAVVFDKIFHEVPAVAITILSGNGIYSQFSSVPDTTGFTVKLYDAAGTAQTGDFSYHSHGV